MNLFSSHPELARTNPDYVIYVPRGDDERVPDTGNEHFLVFRRKDGTLAAVWTQSGHEGQYNQHIVFADSDASGTQWSAPRIIAGEHFDPKTGKDMCSWGYPLVSSSGRIYVLYSKHIGVNDIFTHTTGILTGIYSDDNGKTWSAEETIHLPGNEAYDNPDPAIPQNCITWQKPLRFGDGRYLAGITRWVSPARISRAGDNWIDYPAVVDFIRFENIDADPEVKEIEITLLTKGNPLRFPMPQDPSKPLIQEPTINLLPDGRLFAVMRTVAGVAAFAMSSDMGETWSEPVALRYGDNLPEVKQSLSPCPCYTVGDGEYVLFFHNHDGNFGPWTNHATRTRRPIYMSYGKFDPEGKQPVRFSAPVSWIDSDNVELNHRCDLALYSSFEYVGGKPVLFFPDRKHFLVGKVIDRKRLEEAVFPQK